MNFNFDKSESESISGSGFGNHQDVLKARKKMSKMFTDKIEEVLDGYDGELMAVVRVKEDENGNPHNTVSFVGGISGLESTLQLADAVHNLAHTIREKTDKNLDEAIKVKEGSEAIDKLRKILEEM